MNLDIWCCLSYVLLSTVIYAYGVTCQTMVETTAEGSDCMCRCVLTTKQGQLCNDGVTRETVYLVETIPSGSDCRCSCNTPAPNGCQGNMAQWISTVNTLRKADLVDTEVDDLHRNIAELLAMMSKLDKAFLRSKSKVKNKGLYCNATTEMNNVDKSIAADDEITNKTGMNTPETIGRSNVSENIEDKIALVPELEKVKNNGADDNFSRTTGKENRESFPSPTERPLKMDEVSGGKSEINTISQKITTPQLDAAVHVDATSVLSSTSPLHVDVTNEQTTTPVTTVSSTSASTTTLNENNLPIEPRVQFHPYRSTQRKPDPPSEDPNNIDDDYSYEYDKLDGSVAVKNTKSISPATKATNSFATPISATASSKTISTTSNDSSIDYEYDYDYEEKFAASSSAAMTSTTIPGADPCGILYRISLPKALSKFGRKQGAWLRDPVRMKYDFTNGRRIYVANFFFGNILLEFDDVIGMRQLIYRNSYNLPHKWIGTGHIVYNGSFYYNRAFSTSLIKYDLQHRYVSAWSRLDNAIYQPWTSLNWKGHSLVHLAADETGLWVIYSSRDPYDPHSKLTYIVNKINPIDLDVLKSYKTKFRRPPSHLFMICGVLYSTRGYDSRRASVTDAFDTRTLSRRSFYLEIKNLFSYTVQFSYNPTDRKIYAWDNGNQIEYEVGLMH